MSRVAERAGLERTHLYRKLKQLNIRFSRRGDDGNARSPSATRELAAADVSAPPSRRKRMAPLVIGAIGVVFGDIGTSPLYTLRAVLHRRRTGSSLTPEQRARHPVDHLLGADDRRHARST